MENIINGIKIFSERHSIDGRIVSVLEILILVGVKAVLWKKILQ